MHVIRLARVIVCAPKRVKLHIYRRSLAHAAHAGAHMHIVHAHVHATRAHECTLCALHAVHKALRLPPQAADIIIYITK